MSHLQQNLISFARAAPAVVRARWVRRRETDLHAMVERMDRTQRAHSGEPPSAVQLTRGVGRLAGWFGSGRDCVPRALAVYSILTKFGYGASFVSGVHLVEGDLRSHAWVELNGAAIPRGSDTDGVLAYTENFRHRRGDTSPAESP